ncbi:ABC exporter membrane fusion protein [Waterburya agarophytonicola K14]|uniref:ABC exporter membrane fusion protein n=1 Tax=Waterburya agarophytonicola KI4 TaxID=2874699 RepID=A0A964FFE9_9CYAN|nr:ABC exporter membrane fusion protein [Waterburya agarophytonicola]MCC0176846.1 ABC exporter membrane fusion protein [Waterburya agarophytonicola KI4]
MEYTADNKTKSSKPLVKKIPALVIGLALMLGGVTVYRLTQTDTSQSEVPVQTMPEIKTVTALGRLEPSGEIIQISVSSGASGNRIDELLVKEGDEIEKGQVIAVLDSRDRLEAALNQSQEEVKVAQANLELVKAGAKTGEIKAQEAAIARIEAESSNNIIAQSATVSRIKAELNNAQVEYQRYEQLYQDGAISASERDSKYLALETAKEQVAEAQANLNRIKSSQQEQIAEAKATLNKIAEVRPVDIAVAEAEVRQAQAAVKTTQAELDRAYIKSPQAGTVIKTMIRPGEIASSDEGIARIGQIKEMYAVAEVYESDISKVKLGQPVTVTSSAIEGKLEGTVERIGLEIERQEVVNTDPTSNIDARVVEVKVKLDQESSQKVAGLTNLQVNARIEVASSK